MITEDYVSFETAKLLKENGFDEKTLSYYEDNILCHGDWFEWNRSPLGHIAAPTLQMAMKWLRENYCLHFVIQPMMSMPSHELKWAADTYDVSIFYPELYKFRCVDSTKLCESPEQAVEAALKYSLENLI